MEHQIDLSSLPDEVTNYAFDQFQDRIQGAERQQAEERVFGDDPLSFDYSEQEVSLHRTLLTEILRDAMAEKIQDIEYEIKHNFRDDHTLEDTRQMRETLNELL